MVEWEKGKWGDCGWRGRPSIPRSSLRILSKYSCAPVTRRALLPTLYLAHYPCTPPYPMLCHYVTFSLPWLPRRATGEPLLHVAYTMIHCTMYTCVSLLCSSCCPARYTTYTPLHTPIYIEHDTLHYTPVPCYPYTCVQVCLYTLSTLL